MLYLYGEKSMYMRTCESLKSPKSSGPQITKTIGSANRKHFNSVTFVGRPLWPSFPFPCTAIKARKTYCIYIGPRTVKVSYTLAFCGFGGFFP